MKGEDCEIRRKITSQVRSQRWHCIGVVVAGLCTNLCWIAWSSAPVESTSARFLRFDEVREILDAYEALAGSDSPQGQNEPLAPIPSESEWVTWVRATDAQIRSRIDQGVEDSISNLVLYGTSYTHDARIEDISSAINAQGVLADTVRHRLRALIRTLANPGANERLRLTREFLARQGFHMGPVSEPSGRALEEYLSRNLSRFVGELEGYEEKLRVAGRAGDPGELLSTRGTLFHSRGLSIDTSLLPNYALEETLRSLKEKGVLSPGSIRRVAIIGPGLDFADKRDGYDFYPLQTLQPFAVLEAVERSRLGSRSEISVSTLDLNPMVNAHIASLVEQARAGRPYVVHLPRDRRADWNAQAISYWRQFGEHIGRPTTGRAVPRWLGSVESRAVAVDPRRASRLAPLDLDVVAHTLDLPPSERFELVVATNVLVYYSRFEQSLAMASIGHMMKPGGVFLSNNVLPTQHPSTLEYLGRRSIAFSASRAYGDDVFVYRRR